MQDILSMRPVDYKGTVDALTAAEMAGEKENDIYAKRGMSNYQQKQYSPAVVDLEKSVQAGKVDLNIYEALALSYVASQKEKEALPHLEKAGSLDSKNKDIYFPLGKCPL